MISSRYVLILPIVFLVQSCESSSQHGDVKMIDVNNRFTLYVPYPDRFEFPEVALGHAHTQLIQVRDLPRPVFPALGYIEIQKADPDRWFETQPWQSVRLNLKYRSMSGRVFYETSIDLSQAQLYPNPGREREVKLSPLDPKLALEKLYKYTDYDVIVEVVSPSSCPTDKLNLNTWAISQD